MAILDTILAPKGNEGMTSIATRVDDGTIDINLPFSFPYNSEQVNTLYVSGNSWIGFGRSSEHLKINRRNASINTLYYAEEIVQGMQTVRVRYEGNSTYNNWGSNNLVWELIVFQDGAMVLVIQTMPRSGTNAFANPGGSTLNVSFYSERSYVFMPTTKEGTNYIYSEGSYSPYKMKYLVTDDEGVKAYQNNTWVKIADKPITEVLLIEEGIDELPQSVTGITTNAQVYYYTNEPLNADVSQLELTLKGTSLTQEVTQTDDFIIHEGRIVKEIELDTKDVITVAFSFDSGTAYLIYNTVNDSYEEATEETMFMTKEQLKQMNYEKLQELVTGKIRFKYRFDKPTLEDSCVLKGVKIKYAEWV